MNEINTVFWFLQVFILLLGVALGSSYILYKIHREENRKRELELALMEKRSDLLCRSKLMAQDLEDALYNAKVQQEIDDILRKN